MHVDAEKEALKKEAAYLFKYIAQTGMFVYMESGAIPAMLNTLQDKFKLNYFQLGLLGSIVYLTLSMGCPVYGYLYRHYNAKVILGPSILVNNLTMIFFALCPTEWPNTFIALRALIGLSQAALTVYVPVWIDEFAPDGSHATWMAYLQASTPFGIMFGYMAASVFTFSGATELGGLYAFRWAFLVQVFLVAPYCLGIWFTPSRHINVVEEFRKKKKKDIKTVLENDLASPEAKENNGKASRNSRAGSVVRSLHKGVTYVSGSGCRLSSAFIADDYANLPDGTAYVPPDFPVDEEEGENPIAPGEGTAASELGSPAERAGRTDTVVVANQPSSYWEAIESLVTNPVYISIVLSLSALYFVVTGIQFWATDYLETELGGDPSVVRLQFMFTSATAPVVGVIFGGWFIEFIGGYKGVQARKTALGWCLLFGFFAVVIATFVTIVRDTWSCAVLLWGLLFFGGAVLPGGSGIFISIIPTNIRTIGSSFAAIIFNLLGYFLSPFLSGLISQRYNSLVLGFRIILGWSIFSIFFFGIAYLTSPKGDDAGYKGLLDHGDGKDELRNDEPRDTLNTIGSEDGFYKRDTIQSVM